MFGKHGGSSAHSLDPFAFWPDARSSIAGLGGTDVPPQPDIVFHTCYDRFDSGPLAVELAFTGLSATRGTMLLQANALADDGLPAKVQTRTPIDLAELAATGGHVRLPVIVRPGRRYAFMARLIDDSDAQATALTVWSARHADASRFARRLAAARRTIFASPRDPTGLVVDTVATLADPHSQMCTVHQFDEPDYDRWLGLMHRPRHEHRKQWEHVWIGRVLEFWGALGEGRRGLGFGCGIEPLPAVFAAHGCFVTATDLGIEDRRARRWQETDQHLLSAEALADPAICPSEAFVERVEVRAVDMTAVPKTLVDYDFCWSSCSLEHLGTIDAGLDFIERSLATLKPGGVAVHTTELNLTSDARTIKRGGTVLFRRNDIERFAQRMAKAGHQVLPITWDQGDQPEDQIVDVPPYAADLHFKLALRSYVTTSFGLAIRRGG